MKGFMISLALIVGLGVFTITNSDKIISAFVDDLVKKEGGEQGRPAFLALKFENPAEFTKKFQDVQDKRLLFTVLSKYIGNDATCIKLGKETVTLYLDAPTKKSHRFGKILIFLAEDAEEWNRGGEAFEYYRLLKENFPDHPEAKRVETVMQRLRIKYGLP